MRLPFDYDDLVKGEGRGSVSVALQPGDVIYVP